MKVLIVLLTACSAQFPMQMGLPQMPQMGMGVPQFPQMGFGMPQFPQMGMGMGMGMGVPQMGMGMPQFPVQMGMGAPQFPQANQIGMPQMGPSNIPQILGQMLGNFPKMPTQFGQPIQAHSDSNLAAPSNVKPATAQEKPKAAPVEAPQAKTPELEQAKSNAPLLEAPAKAATAALPAVQAQSQAQPQAQPQIQDIAKWAEAMGMPKMSSQDLTKLVEMQNSMVDKLRSLPDNDVHSMRSQQNQLADEMDAILKNPDEAAIQAFQSKQESLMNGWASKMGLPAVTPQEHEMMRNQVHKMFQQLSSLPSAELNQLRQRHEEIKKMMQNQ